GRRGARRRPGGRGRRTFDRPDGRRDPFLPGRRPDRLDRPGRGRRSGPTARPGPARGCDLRRRGGAPRCPRRRDRGRLEVVRHMIVSEEATAMRAFTAAAIQLAPAPGPLTPASIKSNVDRCVSFVERCVEATGAELVVLPETASTGFTPGVPAEQLWELVDGVPGEQTAPIQDVAARLKV